MKVHAPRRGSMQFWPRKRARKEVPVVKSWPTSNENKELPKNSLLGFAGYKVGMTHIVCLDNYKNSPNKGQEIVIPVTILETPPMLVFAARFYQKARFGTQVKFDIVNNTINKILNKSVDLPKKSTKDINSVVLSDDIIDISLIMATQPHLTTIGQKKPHLTEIKLSGSLEEKLNFVKEHFTKPFNANDVFENGSQIDVHAVSKGKGFQGPVKRFGVQIRHHKSEKTKRGPGSLGAWNAQGHMMYRTAHAGQTGYHTRTDYNKQIISVLNETDKINPTGGLHKYGLVKNSYVLVKGSIPGPKKRIVIMNYSLYPNDKIIKDQFQLVDVVKTNKN